MATLAESINHDARGRLHEFAKNFNPKKGYGNSLAGIAISALRQCLYTPAPAPKGIFNPSRRKAR